MSDKHFKAILLGLLFLIVCGLFSISAKIKDLNSTMKNKQFYQSDKTRYIANDSPAIRVRIVE
ncbi:MAG: hypothetical protein J6Y17_03735 [Elusimicrobiaceae bacterium]|nr:hypothetical protein [Elusimicrobiaceae bacterium]